MTSGNGVTRRELYAVICGAIAGLFTLQIWVWDKIADRVKLIDQKVDQTIQTMLKNQP